MAHSAIGKKELSDLLKFAAGNTSILSRQCHWNRQTFIYFFKFLI